jgi:predicted nucleotidyltransferase component of viral defense system
MDTIAQVLMMDIGFGDVVTPSPIDLYFPILLDYLPSVNIMAYSLETVIAEKMHAIVDLADQSSRMKDYYDLYNILTKEKYDREILQEAIENTFENRHTSYDAVNLFFGKDFANNQQMQVRWQAFMRKLTKAEEVSFNDVVSYLQNQLRPYWERLK